MGMGGDQQVVAADSLSSRFQLRADCAVFGIGGNIKRQHIDLAEQVFDGLEQPFRAALCASIAQFGRHDDACADVALARLGDALRSSIIDRRKLFLQRLHRLEQRDEPALTHRLDHEAIAVTVHDRFVARQLKLHGNTDRLVATISE
jgi:hypothetical protein